MRPLYGARYVDEENARLAVYCRTRLHGLDFDECRAAYWQLINSSLRPQDIALIGCNDRYFLLTAILGRKDAMHPWLYDRCREVEAKTDGFLDLWGREHYKSTIITFAGIIQEIMRDPEITIGLFSFSKDTATKFLKQIKYEFEKNQDLRTAYNDVLWEKPKVQAPSWTDEGLTVRRRSNPKERTVEASGLIDSMPIGSHYRLMVYDDIVTEHTALNPDMVQKAILAWENSDNLGAGDDARKWHIGTRYSFADPYQTIMERRAAEPRIYAATDNGRLDGKPVFISQKRWDEKKNIQRQTVSAQMLQNPIAGRENTFAPGWFKGAQLRPSILNVYIIVDPSGGRSKQSDRTAMAVIGIDPAGNKYLLDGYRHRMPLSERWTRLRDLWRRWSVMPGVQLVRVGYEKYGMQGDLEYIEEKMRLDGPVFGITEVNWPHEGSHSKKARVGRLEPDFRLGRFYLPAVVWSNKASFGKRHPKAGQAYKGPCLWTVNEDKGLIEFEPMETPTRAMQNATASGLGFRVSRPILRQDEDKAPYDVTLALIEEMMTFPFAPKDDLVDAVSRIYDMEPVPPAYVDDAELRTYDFEDA
jgi:hypothetical protein